MPKANTSEPLNGKTPAQIIYNYTKSKDICTRCEMRWTNGTIVCDICAAQSVIYRQKIDRRKDPKRKKDPNPATVEIILAPEKNMNGVLIMVESDVGKLLNIHHVYNVDIIDIRKGGKPKVLKVREVA